MHTGHNTLALGVAKGDVQAQNWNVDGLGESELVANSQTGLRHLSHNTLGGPQPVHVTIVDVFFCHTSLYKTQYYNHARRPRSALTEGPAVPTSPMASMLGLPMCSVSTFPLLWQCLIKLWYHSMS